ncbi:DUF4174 domain-containing protein [Hymenobacter sp. RP-2-7]|uniref:DUF4174 domain-containing protein n=1 Tax=Hymenobacter polaris TaxID=2682546 RepID=A0A7Y0AFI2_9BACT|nr:DUF4174 domain-containing protein [Hymenobacter polaris]NML66424.1 DUF4174 domain-containing protein [Hymenobacter polaris]
MKTLLLLALLATAATAAAAPPSLAATIRASKWKKRVLLVVAPRADEAAYRQQKQLLAATPDGLHERDMLVLDVRGDQLTPADRQYAEQELKLKLTRFEVVLIGKDGGVKQRSPHPLTPQALFGTIDKMPMRRQEMRRGQ